MIRFFIDGFFVSLYFKEFRLILRQFGFNSQNDLSFLNINDVIYIYQVWYLGFQRSKIKLSFVDLILKCCLLYFYF